MSRIFDFLSKKIDKEEMESYIDQPKSQFYQIISRAAIIGASVVAIITLLLSTELVHMSSSLFGVMLTLFFVCFACLFALPWIRKIEKNEFKKTSIIFISFAGVCALMWVICTWLGVGLYKRIMSNTCTEKYAINTLNFIKGSLIVSIQFMCSSVIGACLTKHKNKLIFLQFISYVSFIYIDVYLTLLLSSIKILQNPGLNLNVVKDIDFIFNGFAIAFFVAALLFALLSKVIFNKIEHKQLMKKVVEKEEAEAKQAEVESQPETEI